MKFRFSIRTTLICSCLALGMLRLSYWQWQRYNQKLAFIKVLESNLAQTPAPFLSLQSKMDGEWDKALHHRALISGTFDFEHEMVLRNRRYEDEAGVLILTPLKIDSTDQSVIVQRGFIPLKGSTRTERTAYQKERHQSIIGLIKPSKEKRFLQPYDDQSGAERAWVDSWQRVDLGNMAKQLPYPILPVYLEAMGADGDAPVEKLKEKMIRSDAGRDDMFVLTLRASSMQAPKVIDRSLYPIPVFDTIIPPDRHLGYVYEWGAMALFTIIIGAALQLKRPSGALPDALKIC